MDFSGWAWKYMKTVKKTQTADNPASARSPSLAYWRLTAGAPALEVCRNKWRRCDHRRKPCSAYRSRPWRGPRDFDPWFLRAMVCVLVLIDVVVAIIAVVAVVVVVVLVVVCRLLSLWSLLVFVLLLFLSTELFCVSCRRKFSCIM